MTTPSSPKAARAQLLALAFEAGRYGSRTYATSADWLDFTFREDVEELVSILDETSPDTSADMRAVSEEFERGQLEHKIALLPDGRGWIILWTTAPSDYDSFGTETITSEAIAWYGKTLRSVAVDPHHARYQADRYASGLNLVGDEDPRIEAARAEARRLAWKAEDEARAARTAAGVEHVRQLSDKVLEHPELDYGSFDRLGKNLATREQVQEERAARSLARAEKARAEAWARDTALIPEGSTIVDDGTPGFRDTYGWVAGQPTRVLYSITYGHAWERDPETATVDNGAWSINLDVMAEAIRAGHRFRIVRPDEVPPRAVVERFGHENLKKIEKHAVGLRTVYTCQAHSWSDTEILGEDGKKVRGKKIQEELQGVFHRRRIAPVFQGLVDFLKFAE